MNVDTLLVQTVQIKVPVSDPEATAEKFIRAIEKEENTYVITPGHTVFGPRRRMHELRLVLVMLHLFFNA